ncbi:MAG: ABC transporter ATP-binding protein [Dehalococcoidia bacterium]|nr:MAG: ABC transporter ATP-binding protein [Dehalococcoidia bacterium]
MSTNGTLLQCDGIKLDFGGVKALDDVSFDVRAGEILAIIGPNGAGKTCTINCITGYYRPKSGSIVFDGSNITGLPTHRITRLGIARTFQNIGLYPGLTVLDNLMVGRHNFMKYGFLAGGLYIGRAHQQEIEHRGRVEEIIDFLEIEHIRKQMVSNIAYGLRKRVELGKALALEPKVLLLDEPMSGMNIEEKEDMARFIIDIEETTGIPIVIVEHDMGVIMDISDRIIVLDFGRKVAEGTPQQIGVNPEVIKVYLGGRA